MWAREFGPFGITVNNVLPGFTATAGYTANQTDVVNIASERAAQNQVQKNYQVTAGYHLTLPGQVSLRPSPRESPVTE